IPALCYLFAASVGGLADEPTNPFAPAAISGVERPPAEPAYRIGPQGPARQIAPMEPVEPDRPPDEFRDLVARRIKLSAAIDEARRANRADEVLHLAGQLRDAERRLIELAATIPQ